MLFSAPFRSSIQARVTEQLWKCSFEAEYGLLSVPPQDKAKAFLCPLLYKTHLSSSMCLFLTSFFPVSHMFQLVWTFLITQKIPAKESLQELFCLFFRSFLTIILKVSGGKATLPHLFVPPISL